jgi:hypothetical protein
VPTGGAPSPLTGSSGLRARTFQITNVTQPASGNNFLRHESRRRQRGLELLLIGLIFNFSTACFEGGNKPYLTPGRSTSAAGSART